MSKRPLAVVLVTALVTFFMTLFALEFTNAEDTSDPTVCQTILGEMPCMENGL